MDVSRIKNYGDAPDRAFEAFCSQLFRSWIRRNYKNNLSYFSIVNGKGGDGGVEAYALLDNHEFIGLQCKWFTNAIEKGQIKQIRDSINTARSVRDKLSIYIVCLPRNLASLKKGRDGENIQESEDMRLQLLKRAMELKHKGLEVRYWLEDDLLTELQHPENEGISRYWLGEEVITFNNLKFRFKMAKDSWLKERYTPLSLAGGISKVVEEMVLPPEFINAEIEQLQKLIAGITNCQVLLGEYISLNTYFPQLNGQFQNMIAELEPFKHIFLEISGNLGRGIVEAAITVPNDLDLWPLVELLSITEKGNMLRNIIPKLQYSLRDLHAVNLSQYVLRLTERLAPHNQIILGPVGTGKTHGIAKAVEGLLQADLPAIIIRAKGTNCASWGEVLAHSIGGGEWTDLQLFNALESLAIRMSVNRAFLEKNDSFKNHTTKLLIAIDGVDEASDWEPWKDRVKECPTFMEKFPMIRFLISARSYPPNRMNPCDLFYDGQSQRRYDVDNIGDASLYELIPIYLKEYKISYEKNSWILYSFENAIALRLFCEENKNKKISEISDKPVFYTLSILFKSKIKRIDAEFYVENKGLTTKESQIIHKVLMELAILFQTQHRILREELLNMLSGVFKTINPLLLEKALDKITEHAFLQKEFEESMLEPTRILYSIGLESYLEYLIAISYAENIFETKNMVLPDFLKIEKNKNIRYLTAVILLVDHGLLVGKQDLWQNDFQEMERMLLQFEVFRRSPDAIVASYISLVKTYFLKSESFRNLTIEHFILPNINREELALGTVLVHKTMKGFGSVYERDQFWSGPDNLHTNRSSPLSLYLEHEHLSVLDLATGKALLMAWSLASLDKEFREKVRKELLDWSLYDIARFVELLELMFDCGDPQILEDLAIIILGISADLDNSIPNIDVLTSWVMTNVFSAQTIVSVTDSVIRHCCRTFIERAVKLGICTDQDLLEVQSPFAAAEEYLELDFDSSAVYNNRDGRFPIEHDLYWNVIEESYEGFLTFKHSGTLDDRAKAFMEPYNQKYGTSFNPKTFVVAAALIFIKKLGWDKTSGFADQGGVRYMSFEEKYTLCAVRAIQGFLADRLPYEHDSEPLTDYGRIVSVHNPSEYGIAQQVVNYPNDRISIFLPEDFSEKLRYTVETLADDVKKWVKDSTSPLFDSWIHPNGLGLNGVHSCEDQWVTLYCHTALPEINGLGRSRLRGVCLLIAEDEFEIFKQFMLSQENTFEHSSISPNDFFAGIDGNIYQSLKDILWMDSTKEYSEPHEITNDDNYGAEVYATVTEITENKVGAGERSFLVPSALIRESLGITKSDKRGFFDADGNLKALMFKHFESDILDQRLTLADQASFDNMFNEKSLKPFWLFEHYRATTDAKILKQSDAEFRHCKKWVYFHDTKESREIFSDEHC
ncbi:hypothetical protein ACEN2P_08195 [Pedobacter psychrotolerans]|uniref:hypothetical protein n=1 Tax=Pedobacter psychrotolerans TaxID=1843235 RepID=UPI003F9E8FFE